MGLDPHWVAPKGLFAISIDGQEQYINQARSPLNSHASMSLSRNKYFTRCILERHGMPNIPFARPKSQADALAFFDTHNKIIAKPTSGSGAHDIHIITTAAQLEDLNITKYILEKYITGQELRYLVLDGAVIGVHRSDYGSSVQEDRSLQRISYPSTTWDPVLTDLATAVADILRLKFAAVDYLIDESGRHYILEVNSAPGLKWFHQPTSGPAVDVASQFLESAFKMQDNVTLNI